MGVRTLRPLRDSIWRFSPASLQTAPCPRCLVVALRFAKRPRQKEFLSRERKATKGIPFAGAKGENLMRATREEGLDVETKALISIGRWAILLPLGTRGPMPNTACTGAPEPDADLVH